MHSSEPSQRWLSGRGCAQKVLCWRSICVLYSMLCLAALPNPAESVRARCGRELVADLVFVCGDRGLYFGKARNGPPAGKGIVDQCCRKGCDLQHLEAYCAKPKRSRRYAPPTPEQVMEEQFQGVFQRQIMKHFDQEAGHSEERQTYRDKVHHQHKREPKGALLREIYTEHHTSRASSDQRNPLKATTQPS